MTDEFRARFEREALPHLKAVYNLARRLTRREDAARDLTQETFLRAYRKFDSFAAGTNCRAWLFAVTYSLFVNAYHRQHREPELSAIDIDDIAATDGSGWTRQAEAGSRHGPAATPARLTAEADVEAALAALPDEFRVAVLLVDVEELSYEQAAAAIGCPVGTLRSRLFRARTQLANRLRDYDITHRRSS